MQSMNKSTLVTTTVVSVMLAIAGFVHGLFEALQGNKATEGNLIQAIGSELRWWKYGTEEAFTILPNYLVTGIAAMLVSVFIIAWSVKYVQTRRGSAVLLFSFILLTLVGGGLGFIPFYLVTWAYSTRKNNLLGWWESFIPETSRIFLARTWKFSLFVFSVSWIIALEIAIFGFFPGKTDAEKLLTTCWSFLFLSFVFIHLSFFAAFARDIQERNS